MMMAAVVVLLHTRCCDGWQPNTADVGGALKMMVISPSHQTRRLLSSQHSQQRGLPRGCGAGDEHTQDRAKDRALPPTHWPCWLACLLALHACIIHVSSRGPRCHRNILTWPPSDSRLSVCCSVACISTEIASQTPCHGRARPRRRQRVAGCCSLRGRSFKLGCSPGGCP
jgi:hypothetical protein